MDFCPLVGQSEERGIKVFQMKDEQRYCTKAHCKKNNQWNIVYNMVFLSGLSANVRVI